MKRIGIIGVGYAGSTIAYNIINKQIVDELYIYDINEAWLLAQRNDLEQASMLNDKITRVVSSSLQDLKKCDIIVNTASAKVLTANRLAELEANREIIKDIFTGFSDYKGIIINISNPCDIITKLIVDISGLNPNRVLGSGTILDSLRLRATISNHYKIDPHEVKALVMGEHGSLMYFVFSQTFINNVDFFTYLKDNNLKYDEDVFYKEVLRAGHNIFDVKGRTEYGIANSVFLIIESLLKEDITPLTISAPTYYKDKLIYTSRLVNLNNTGYLSDQTLNLNEIEKDKYQAVLEHIYKILYS